MMLVVPMKRAQNAEPRTPIPEKNEKPENRLGRPEEVACTPRAEGR